MRLPAEMVILVAGYHGVSQTDWIALTGLRLEASQAWQFSLIE